MAPGPESSGARRTYRVLMVAPTSFFADYGCHVRILEEARTLQGRGHHVTICTYANGRDWPGLDIRRTMTIPWRRGYEVGSSRHKIAFDALLLLRGLTCLPTVRPQIIHAHLHEGALIGQALAAMCRAPLVFDFQGSLTGEMVDHGFLSPQGRFYGPTRRLETWIDRCAPHILTSSAHAAELLTREFGCAPGRITTVPDAVNTDEFHPMPRGEAWARRLQGWGLPSSKTIIVYLGLLAGYQGTDHLLQAARALRDVRNDLHWLIAGYPHVETYRQRAIALRLEDCVTFTGQVPYEAAPGLLSLGDIAVAPKLSKTEGAGKLLNYMAMALPTVAFDTPVSREYLGPTGVYALAGDSADLARCVAALADNPAQRQAVGAALRLRAEACYAWDGCIERIEGVYDAALAGHSPA